MTSNRAPRRFRSVTGLMSATLTAATDSSCPCSLRRPPAGVARFLRVRKLRTLLKASPTGGDPAPSVRARVRRVLMAVFGLQVLLAVVLTLVDSYRRRGKRPKPFETRRPTDVTVGDGTVTSYT